MNGEAASAWAEAIATNRPDPLSRSAGQGARLVPFRFAPSAAARAGRSWRLTDCTLYSTLEPCPMCAGALHAARISRLVYATSDPKAGAAGTLYDFPTDYRLNHTYPYTRGILQSEAAALLQIFFKQLRE